MVGFPTNSGVRLKDWNDFKEFFYYALLTHAFEAELLASANILEMKEGGF